jgi:integrase
VDGGTKGRAEELLIAWLKTRLARLCAQLELDKKLSAVFSWHDFRHAFAQRNAGRRLVWLRDRLGHDSVSVTERYLRNVLHVDTGKM